METYSTVHHSLLFKHKITASSVTRYNTVNWQHHSMLHTPLTNQHHHQLPGTYKGKNRNSQPAKTLSRKVPILYGTVPVSQSVTYRTKNIFCCSVPYGTSITVRYSISITVGTVPVSQSVTYRTYTQYGTNITVEYAWYLKDKYITACYSSLYGTSTSEAFQAVSTVTVLKYHS